MVEVQVQMKSNDHWAFLEEIEAPMWVDLTSEGKSHQNFDDKWFSISHSIHQCSSKDLKLAFSQPFEDHKTLYFELSGFCSPNLPGSVSRSRGKDYDNEKLRGSCRDFEMDKHIISEKLNFGSATKLKPRTILIDPKRTSNSKSRLVSASSSSENVMAKMSNSYDRSGSSITTGISCVQQKKLLEVSSQPLGTTSTLISVLRRSLKKSIGHRQASRFEVNDSQRQSGGHISSSSKSSVSSSSGPGAGIKNVTSTFEQHQKNGQRCKNFSKMTQAAMNKTKISSISSTLKIQVDDVSSCSRSSGKVYSAKFGHLEASKPKIVRVKASLPKKRDEQNACLKPKEKVGTAGAGRVKTAVVGKENVLGKFSSSKKCVGRDPSTVNVIKDRKRTQHSVPQSGRHNVVNSKSKQGKNCHPSERGNVEIANQRIYLR